MKRISILILIALMTSRADAQKISLDRIELVRDKLVVYYSLEDDNPNHQYQVDLYSSKDNFAVPLTKVKGNVGSEVKPGKDRSIEWNIVQEIGNYSGDIAIEVRARVFVPFVKITGLKEGTVYKRGRSYPLLWTSGNMGGQVDIELYNGQSRVGGDRNVPNTGKYEYAIPGSVKPGKDYKLKFTNTRNRDEFVYSAVFRITPRIPFVVKVGGALVVLGGVAFIAGAGGDGGGGTEKTPTLAGHPLIPD
jgi:hypothetical protein